MDALRLIAATAKDDEVVELTRLSPQQFDQFRAFIYQQSGICVDEKKVTLLSNRIRRRVKAGQFENFDAYYRFLTSANGRRELEGFLDAVTTNETFFFRTSKHFDWLSKELLAELLLKHRAGLRPPSLRIWSAACASGAEPYSIAICLAENNYRLRGWSLEIVGTDISEQALNAARGGKFDSKAVEMLTDQQRRRFFRYQADDEVWQVRPEVKELVKFRRHNLMRPFPEPGFDCIFIRNVLIYFDRASKQTVISNLQNAMQAGGYLVVGPSEGIYDMLDPLEKVSPFLYKNVEDAKPRAAGGSREACNDD